MKILEILKRWHLLVLCLALAAVIPFGITAYSEDDSTIACDLAAISSIAPDTINQIYEAVGDWDDVRKNIFVYRDILKMAQSGDYGKVISRFSNHDPKELLTVYEFISGSGQELSKADVILDKVDTGVDLKSAMESIEIESKEGLHSNYAPAGKDSIRKWLAYGYSPNDILAADKIAMEKDVKIEDILDLKNKDNTWEGICAGLDYETENTGKTAHLKIKRGGTVEEITAESYDELFKKVRLKSSEFEQATVGYEAVSLSNQECEKYKSMGFNKNELKNAARLSLESGAPIDEILSLKRSGQSWESVIEKYSGKEGTGVN